jgi:UDP-N-acetylmuramyl pentapeptide phosphotransferase/UDP-N-acetylglucosamine-1-phosphate transferase
MGYLLASTAISFAVALFFVRRIGGGATWGSDSDFDGPQKFHCCPVPRLGGFGIAAAVAACAVHAQSHSAMQGQLVWLVVCAVPALAYGLAEDITLSVSPRQRLAAAAVSAGLGAYFLGAVVHRTGFEATDALLASGIVAVPFTLFAVAGMANAVNIIDGFNGLASMVCMMMFGAVACVAYSVDDPFILLAAVCCIGALLGFFVLNFPRGRIFLGDGGAYFTGFVLAELAVLLVQRHPAVSPWFAVLLFVYPTVETAFSIYRRKVLKGAPIASPDASHLHSLVFRRLLHSRKGDRPLLAFIERNPRTSVYLWVLSSLAIVPAALFWHSTPVLMLFCAGFLALYLWIYRSIVRFKTAGWPLLRRARNQSLCLSASVVNESAKNSSAGS